MRKLLPLVTILMLTACSSGFDRGAIRERLEGQALQVTDHDVRVEMAKRPQIRFPIKVAVQMVADTYNKSQYKMADKWRWTQEDKERVEAWAERLRADGIASDVFVMSDLVTTGTGIKEARVAAAKHGADTVFLVKGVAQLDSYYNATAALNLLVVPGFFVPGSNRDVLMMMKGAMWDVANEYLYLTVDEEIEVKTKSPSFRVDEDKAFDMAKEQVLTSFGDEFVQRMRSLKGVE